MAHTKVITKTDVDYTVKIFHSFFFCNKHLSVSMENSSSCLFCYITPLSHVKKRLQDDFDISNSPFKYVPIVNASLSWKREIYLHLFSLRSQFLFSSKSQNILHFVQRSRKFQGIAHFVTDIMKNQHVKKLNNMQSPCCRNVFRPSF